MEWLQTSYHSKVFVWDHTQWRLFIHFTLLWGRATDIHIVRDSGFLKKLEPFDQVMADRVFKIQNDLLSHSATLCIPPSMKTSRHMLSKEVKETSRQTRIANVRIYVEQAIKRLKECRIIKNELPVLLLPVIDDIVTVCTSLVNILYPLCDWDWFLFHRHV